MSKITEYVNLHRTSRSKFLSIADFNQQYNANLPVNKVAEASFHADLRRKRRMMFPVRETALYPIARELGRAGVVGEKASRSAAPRRMISRSMRRRPEALPCGHKSKKKCDCDDEDKPVRRVGMKLSNISISRPKAAPIAAPVIPSTTHMIDTRRAPTKAPSGHNNNDKKQRKGNKHPKGSGHQRHSLGGRHAVSSPAEEPGAFSVSDAKAFYMQFKPEFLEENDIHEVVQEWNKESANVVMDSIRAKYGQAPKDLWSVDDVRAFYSHYDSDFLSDNNLNDVMNGWTDTEPALLKSLLTERYGSCPAEPFKTVNWTPSIVTQYYNEVFPAKLQQETPRDIIAGWNKYSIEEVMSACKSRYGVAPTPVNYVAPKAAEVESHIESYKRMLEDSGAHFDATKILHFVPTNVAFGDFASHATKFKASAARFLIDGVKGPYKMFNSEYKTFSSINSDDVNTVMKAVKQNKSGDFFIRVTE